MQKILIVLTSHSRDEKTGKPTGFWLEELTHFCRPASEAGFELDFASPQGGKPFQAPRSGWTFDRDNRWFWKNQELVAKLGNTLKPSQVNPENYCCIFYVGGHGANWDLPHDQQLAQIAAKIYENGGPVAAVCHGPAGLVNIKLSNGEYLIKGKRVNGFSNTEEWLYGGYKFVPMLTESGLRERGGLYRKGLSFMPHIEVDGRLVTGQNPFSTRKLFRALLPLLRQ